MKITNASSKVVTLANGKQIKPKATIVIDIKKGSDLYEQVSNLAKKGILDIKN